MLTQAQKAAAIAGSCFALRFLVDSENRHHARSQMAGFSDAAIFHRWMSLAWTLREPKAITLLTSHELRLLAKFNEIYETIAWVPLATHPFVSDASEKELHRLRPVASQSLQSLENRSHKTSIRRLWLSWWRWLRSNANRAMRTNRPMDPIGGSTAS